DDLDRGFFLLWLLGDVAVAQVFPEAAVAGDGLEQVEAPGWEPWHAGLLSVAVGDVRPAGFVLVLRPQEILRLIADGVEVLLDVEVELERIGSQSLFDLRLAVEGFCSIARHVQRLGGELRWSPSALDREQDFVKEVKDSGVQILFVGLLLLFQLVALRVASGDTTVSFLRGVELTGSIFDTPH